MFTFARPHEDFQQQMEGSYPPANRHVPIF
jgi:hypothetical protein